MFKSIPFEGMKRLPPLPDKREIAIWRPFGTNSVEPSSSSAFSEMKDIGSVGLFGYLWPQKMQEFGSLWPQK